MLLSDEIAIYRKLIYRDAEEYLCKKCLASELRVDEAELDRKIEYFRRIGCTLFN